jgi:hypothetical protein
MQTLNVKTINGGQTSIDMTKIEAFHSTLRGDLLYPNNNGYEDARRIWNGMIDKKPALIARCKGTADVISAVNFARDNHLLFTVRGGGHNVAGGAICDGGMVIDLSKMRSVRVDPGQRTARAEAGATLGDLDHETQAFGLSAPVGVVSATGIAGLTLHGGLGWLTRKYGMTVDNLLTVDVVTADGQLLKASTDENADLLWAVKGGGGNFGIVTSFEFRLHPVGPMVWLAVPMYAAEKGEDGLRFFRDFMAEAPEELGAIAVFWNAPEEPPIPEEARGTPVIIFLACYTGPFEKGEEVIRPLREFDTPMVDLSGPMRFVEVQKFLDADYPDGMFYYWKSLYLENLSDEIISAIAGHAAERPSPITSVDVWGLGGKMGRTGPGDTPLVRRPPFLLGIESNWEKFEDSDKNIGWTREVYKDMERFSQSGLYLNFPGFAEEGDHLLKGAYGSNYERLQTIKAKYDPNNLFQGNLNIEPA